MIRKEGYVCVVRFEDAIKREIFALFGVNKGRGKGSYCNLHMNDLTPYETEKEAVKGWEELNRDERFKSVRLARLKMDISENADEFDEFEGLDSIVVVALNDSLHETWLLGPFMKGRPSFAPIPGAYIYDVSLETFDSLERAKSLCREVNRQMQCGARIASFELEYL